MDLNALLIFTRVVAIGSFTGAARELAMPKSTVSRRVSQLEADLGARLLHRTTRRLSLTDVGQAFHRHAERAVAAAEEAELAVGRMQEVPRGLLRVTAPVNLAFLGPIVASFLERHDEVQLELVCTDRIVDLVEDGFDVAIRTGRLADSTLIARRVGVLRSFVVASPEFLDRHGRPDAPHQLARYACVVFGLGDRASWTLHTDREEITVPVTRRLAVNDLDVLDEAVLAGLGVAMVPSFRCAEHLRAGRLERVLVEWCSGDIPLHAVYPSTLHLSTAVKAFLDHLGEQMNALALQP